MATGLAPGEISDLDPRLMVTASPTAASASSRHSQRLTGSRLSSERARPGRMLSLPWSPHDCGRFRARRLG